MRDVLWRSWKLAPLTETPCERCEFLAHCHRGCATLLNSLFLSSRVGNKPSGFAAGKMTGRSSSLLLLGAFLLFISPPNNAVAALVNPNHIQQLGGQGVNLWKLDAKLQKLGSPKPQFPQGLVVQDPDDVSPDIELPGFRGHWFRQPLDHFSNSTRTFRQRYWVNDRHYRAHSGGPVIVIDGGETSGEDRLPFLDTGIAEILANATGGIGVVLEHR